MKNEPKVSAPLPKTETGKKLMDAFKLLAKQIEPSELNKMLPALMKIAAGVRRENEQTELDANELRNEATFLYSFTISPNRNCSKRPNSSTPERGVRKEIF